MKHFDYTLTNNHCTINYNNCVINDQDCQVTLKNLEKCLKNYWQPCQRCPWELHNCSKYFFSKFVWGLLMLDLKFWTHPYSKTNIFLSFWKTLRNDLHDLPLLTSIKEFWRRNFLTACWIFEFCYSCFRIQFLFL